MIINMLHFISNKMIRIFMLWINGLVKPRMYLRAKFPEKVGYAVMEHILMPVITLKHFMLLSRG